MFTGLLLLATPALAAVGLAVSLRRRPIAHLDADGVIVVRRLRRRFLGGLLLGCLLGSLVFAAVLLWPPIAGTETLGLGAAVAPMAATATLFLLLCLTELTTPIARGPVRSATLSTRTVADVIDRRDLRWAAGGLGLLVVLLVIGALMGDPDDLGRAGRAISSSCGAYTFARGPWPGSFYGMPMLVAIGVVLVVAAATLVAVTRRAHESAATARADHGVRRTSARRVLMSTAALGFVVSVPIAALMSSGLLGLQCRPWTYTALGGVLVLVVLGSAALAAWCFGSIVVAPRIVEVTAAATSDLR